MPIVAELIHPLNRGPATFSTENSFSAINRTIAADARSALVGISGYRWGRRGMGLRYG
jgi:hypothetical protein